MKRNEEVVWGALNFERFPGVVQDCKVHHDLVTHWEPVEGQDGAGKLDLNGNLLVVEEYWMQARCLS